MKWGHDQLQHDLAGHLRGSRDRIVWENMQLGPSGSPRPDVYTLPCSYSRFTPLAYECKISRADFLRDVTSGKWQSYLKFASAVIFAAPTGLVKKEEIPPGCGLIVRHDEVWRMAKGPTLRIVESLPLDAWMKLVIDGIGRQPAPIRERIFNQYTTQQKVAQKWGDNLARLLSDKDSAEYQLQREIDRLAAERKRNVDEYDLERDQAMQRRKDALAEVSAPLLELKEALGLPDNCHTYALIQALRGAVDRINQTEEVARLRQQLERARKALDDGLASIVPESA